jgi:uncharacterized protein YdhG (YjbR/CyaY superfamily)
MPRVVGGGFRNANQTVVGGVPIRLSRPGTDAIEYFWRSRLRRRLLGTRIVHQISERRKTNTMPAEKVTKKSARGTAANRKVSMAFTEDEKAAMRELVRERQRSGDADGEAEVLAKIAEMREPDRAMAKRIHALVKASAPAISPKTWYGMPAYAKDGKVVCFFQSGQKFKTRYATFGFNDSAHLDEGVMWPVAFALKELGAAEEARIGALVKKAVR